eukprot:TRINITY_DN1398_c2_g1_i4.p1 TRINITY_DN1398_c2_g1~~TRINITY_DN1398_c2_g1_i4.p1  ORF type:complete len:629 (+),score=189.65 TRINITY_DN1398_c2_g1_i4:45-1931(+)
MRRTTRVFGIARNSARPSCNYKYSTQSSAVSRNENNNNQRSNGGLSKEEIQQRVEKYYSEKEPKGQPRKETNTEPTYFTQAYRRWRERETYDPVITNKKRIQYHPDVSRGKKDVFLYQLPSKYAIKVKERVYGRPSLHLLQTLSSSTIDLKSRSLSAQTTKTAPNVFSFYPSTSTTPASNAISLDSYKILFRAVRRALSDSPTLFILDSELPGSKTRVRIVTDSIATAIWSKINLPPAPGLSKSAPQPSDGSVLHPIYEGISIGQRNWEEFEEDVLVFATSNLSEHAIYGPETIPRPTRFTSGGAAGGANLPGKAENKGQIAVGEFYNAIKTTRENAKNSKNNKNNEQKQSENKTVDDGNNNFVLENYQHKQVVVGLFEDSSNKLGPFVGGEQLRESIRKVASYSIMREDPDSFTLPFADALLIQPKQSKDSSSSSSSSSDYMNGRKSVVVVDLDGGSGVRSAFYGKDASNLNNVQLYAGHDVVFKGDRIYPLWSGVNLSGVEAQKGSLVEGGTVSNGLKTVFSRGAPAPSAVVFLDKGAKSGTYNKLTAEEGWAKLEKKVGEGVLGQEAKRRWQQILGDKRILSMGVSEGGLSKIGEESRRGSFGTRSKEEMATNFGRQENFEHGSQ